MIRRLLRDPLAHFLLGGALLWLFLAWRGEEADPASRSITITRARQAALAANFGQLMGRPPTDAELSGLVRTDVREEILYREALRLGLDADDPVVRRRLVAKMDALAAAEVESAVPGDAVLARWRAKHPARFLGEPKLTFAQKSFATEAEASAALAANGSKTGRAFDLPAAASAMPGDEVARVYGLQFAQGLAALLPSPRWQGPVPSGLGWHIVRLDRRETVPAPPIAAVRDEVEDDWRSATMQARREAAYRLLADAYRVEIEE